MPDFDDDDASSWEDDAASHFHGDWREAAARHRDRRGRTVRKPYERSMTTNTEPDKEQ